MTYTYFGTFFSTLMKRAIALHHEQRARNANSSTATSASKIPVSGGLVAHWGGTPTPAPAADWVLWSVIYALVFLYFLHYLAFKKTIAQPCFATSLPWNHGCSHVSYELYGCVFASFMQHFLVGQLSTLAGSLPPWASRSWRCTKKPSSRTDKYRCILLWVFQKAYVIYNSLQIASIPSHKEMLSSGDHHQLTFYLTCITSDMWGLHFSPKKKPPGCSQ